MKTIQFIPCIYLYEQRAVAGTEDHTVISEDPIALARACQDCRCDQLLVFDLSDGDQAHEEALDLIRSLCAAVAVPVIGAGNIRRMEDVKKLLYAGCRQALLDYSRQDNIDLTREVSLKFGSDRLLAALDNTEKISTHSRLLEQYISGVLLTGQTALPSGGVEEAQELSPVPVCVLTPEIALDKLIGILKLPNVSGIAGPLVNANLNEIPALKELCEQNGMESPSSRPAFAWQDFKRNSDGLLPVIVQDWRSGEVLMQAYMNEEAYLATLQTGKMTYYSRSRREQWVKGATSGHFQYVKSLKADCDMDTLLAKVVQIGNACHTGAYSCFFHTILEEEENASGHNPARVFEEVFSVIQDRREHPREGSYTNYLFDKGLDKILKKLGEEATEIVIAAKNPNAGEIKYEICDFLYHMMVLMAEKGLTWEEIMEELARR